jgi:hypothetical protein
MSAIVFLGIDPGHQRIQNERKTMEFEGGIVPGKGSNLLYVWETFYDGQSFLNAEF